jgi:hypothetical protein
VCWIDVADLVFRGISTPWSASIATGHRATARTMMTSTMQKAILDIPSYELSLDAAGPLESYSGSQPARSI